MVSMPFPTEFRGLKKCVTDGRTDGRSNGRMDVPSCRDAWTHLKKYFYGNLIPTPSLFQHQGHTSCTSLHVRRCIVSYRIACTRLKCLVCAKGLVLGKKVCLVIQKGCVLMAIMMTIPFTIILCKRMKV